MDASFQKCKTNLAYMKIVVQFLAFVFQYAAQMIPEAAFRRVLLDGGIGFSTNSARFFVFQQLAPCGAIVKRRQAIHSDKLF
jgi:hypothetical protein